MSVKTLPWIGGNFDRIIFKGDNSTWARLRTCTMLRLSDYTCQYMHRYACSECGEQNEQPTVMGESEPPNYCPNCGARVVER